jgi:hypothetical protein
MTISATSQGLRPGVVTSSNRPANPYDGMMIYETDTNLVRIWNGSAWKTLAYSDYTSGSVIQVASTFKADAFSTNSTSFVDVTGLSVDITPTSTSSKIFVLAYVTSAGSTTNDYYLNLNRGATAIAQTTSGSTISTWHGFVSSTAMNMAATITFLDSPSTTSSTTYKIQARAGSDTMYVNRRGADTLGSTSSITVMEIAG